MARFKNKSGEDRRVGRADGPLVAAGDVTTVEGEVLAELDDAWVTGSPEDVVIDPETKEPTGGFTGDARAWPKETWDLLDKPAAKPAKQRAATAEKDGE